MKNDEKNLKNLEGRKKFSKDYQPSRKAKSKGWERKRVGQEMMDKVYEYLKLPAVELKKMAQEILAGSKKYTALEMKVIIYISTKKFTIDLFNRAVPYAPKEIDLTSKGEALQGVSPELKAIALDLKEILNDTKPTQHKEGKENSEKASS